MAFCRLVLPFLVICIASTYGKVPVFLWGDLVTSIKSNPLSSVTDEDFKAILQKELKSDPFTVIFLDETLSVEDFSLKNSDGDSSFPYLHANIGKAVYLPGVENALPIVNELADSEKVDSVKLTENGLSAEFKPQSVKILFIELKDAKEGESRADLLRRHNDFMEEMFGKLQSEYENVVAIYTARNPSWTVFESHRRVRRQAESTDLQNITLNGLKMYVKRVVVTVDTTVTNVTEIDNARTEINGTEMSTTMTSGDSSLTLNFLQKAGYWFFSSVTYKQADLEVNLMPEVTEVHAPVGFAYRCGQNVTFSYRINQTIVVTFQDLKVQPYFKENGNETLFYGDSINCVGFFTVPIWSGLFVTFILLAITFYGIMMMMDIRTMDRFDDPKGKTISINAE
ncbi:V-type proton ATPase subunit S1 [Maniola hyperantus]|uniref:V-type proton ATPase subunit S1 n=1 Tax=Aphantopus hyperantus TaxID=2795564 RepID=UPI001569F058|nr:V-type proton ATPase subunit S1 [Maniola hyperantus]